MAGYTQKIDVSYYNDLFVRTFKENLNLYWQARKFKVEGPKVALLSEPKKYQTEVEEISNWENFSTSSYPVPDLELERIVIKLSIEAALSVEIFLRKFAAKNGNAKDVRNVFVTDLFERADGTPNLKVNIVINAPLSVTDPAGLVPGWVAYKFFFACGFPVKAESEYNLSQQAN